MPAPTSPRYAFNLLVEGQAGGEPTANSFLLFLEAVKNGKVLSRTLGTPPGSPVNGNLHIIPTGATGVWAAHVGKYAWYWNGYIFVTPQEGDIVRVVDENAHFAYSAAEALWYPLVDSFSTFEHWTGKYYNGSKVFAKSFSLATAGGGGVISHGITGLILTNLISCAPCFEIPALGWVIIGSCYIPSFATSFATIVDSASIIVVIDGAPLIGVPVNFKCRLEYTKA